MDPFIQLLSLMTEKMRGGEYSVEMQLANQEELSDLHQYNG